MASRHIRNTLSHQSGIAGLTPDALELPPTPLRLMLPLDATQQALDGSVSKPSLAGTDSEAVFGADGFMTEWLVFPGPRPWRDSEVRMLGIFEERRRELGDPMFAVDMCRDLLPARYPGKSRAVYVEYFYDEPLPDGTRSVLVNIQGELDAWLVLDAEGRLFDGAAFPSPEERQTVIGTHFCAFILRRIDAGDRRVKVVPAGTDISGMGAARPAGGWTS